MFSCVALDVIYFDVESLFCSAFVGLFGVVSVAFFCLIAGVLDGKDKIHLRIKHAWAICNGCCNNIHCSLVVTDLSYGCGGIVGGAIGGEEFAVEFCLI